MLNLNLIRIIVAAAIAACVLFAVAAQTPPTPPTKPGTAPTKPDGVPPLSPEKPTKPDQPPSTQPALPKTVLAVPRAEQWWIDRHNQIIRFKTIAPIDLVFLGDSITQGWEQTGANVRDKYYARRKPMNLGFSGDRTQHALWRVRHNELDGYSPKLAVVMIGTNNSNGDDHTAEEIAEGIKAVVSLMREKQPNMKILLLAIFPRGETPNPQREKNAKASELASAVADGQMVQYMDIGSKFMNADGTISKEIMPDFLHLSEKGYQIWAEAIEDKVVELLGETAGTPKPKPMEP